jgi:hypothetical protein
LFESRYKKYTLTPLIKFEVEGGTDVTVGVAGAVTVGGDGGITKGGAVGVTGGGTGGVVTLGGGTDGGVDMRLDKPFLYYQ